MMPQLLSALLIISAIAHTPAGFGAQASLYKKEPGPWTVESLKEEWTDATRARQVPVKIYFPKTGTGPYPVIIFSHGLGGTRDGYEYLGHHWASHGYVSVHVQHLGSDSAVWQDTASPMKAMQQAAASLTNALNRPLDVSFAIDQITRLNKAEGVLRNRLDLNRVGVAGHSFGAYTTLAAAGQVFGPTERGLGDERVKAAIAMSAPVPRANAGRSYSRIRIPILHMTGTEDYSPIGDTSPKDRRVPFDRITGAAQFLVTFTGGDHMIFSGRSGLRGERKNDERFHDLIKMSSTAFWDAYLKQDTEAKEWLAKGGFQAALGNDGVFEQKTGEAAAGERTVK